jgi:hypothetical protein
MQIIWVLVIESTIDHLVCDLTILNVKTMQLQNYFKVPIFGELLPDKSPNYNLQHAYLKFIHIVYFHSCSHF